MANNSILPVAPGGTVVGPGFEQFANQDIGGSKFPSVVVHWGAAGVANPASAANPFPVVQQGNISIGSMPTAILNAETTKVIGTVNQGSPPWAMKLDQTTPNNVIKIDSTQILPPGIATADNSAPVVQASMQWIRCDAGTTTNLQNTTGAAGDFLDRVWIIPEHNANPGTVILHDGASYVVTIFAGGTNSVVTMVPFPFILGGRSFFGKWAVECGALIHCVATGRFT